MMRLVNDKTITIAWFNLLPPYIGMLPILAMSDMPRPPGKSLYICPSAKPEPGLINDKTTYYCSYAQNCWIHSREQEDAPHEHSEGERIGQRFAAQPN